MSAVVSFNPRAASTLITILTIVISAEILSLRIIYLSASRFPIRKILPFNSRVKSSFSLIFNTTSHDIRLARSGSSDSCTSWCDFIHFCHVPPASRSL